MLGFAQVPSSTDDLNETRHFMNTHIGLAGGSVASGRRHRARSRSSCLFIRKHPGKFSEFPPPSLYRREKERDREDRESCSVTSSELSAKLFSRHMTVADSGASSMARDGAQKAFHNRVFRV